MDLTIHENNIKADLELADLYLKSKLLPKHYTTPEQVYLVMAKGREIGIKPIHALNHIYIVNGVPSMRGELMLYLIKRHHPKARISFIERSEERAVIEVDHNGLVQRFEFTWARAVKANLIHKGCWKEYPIAMLTWRCVADMARLVFPDALHGISHTPEELGEETDDRGVPLNAQPASQDGPRILDIESVNLMPEEIEVPEEPMISEEKEKLTKLLHVLTSESVGFTVAEVESCLGSRFDTWGMNERVELENAVRRLKKSNTPEQNKQILSLFLGESL